VGAVLLGIALFSACTCQGPESGARETGSALSGAAGRGGAGSPLPGAAASARFWGNFTRADVIRAAGSDLDQPLTWRIAEWRPRKGAVVALSFHAAEFGGEPDALEPRLYMLQNRAGKLALVVSQKLDLSQAECRNESGEPATGGERAPEFAFDLGPYTIAPDSLAVGVRFTCFNSFPAGDGSETRLLLLELRDGALHQVFDETIAQTSFDRPTGNQTNSDGVMSVRREKQDGHFDLSVRTTTKTVGSDPESFPKTLRHPIDRTETVRFQWNGTRYVTLAPR
jgi:hypothetical protein